MTEEKKYLAALPDEALVLKSKAGDYDAFEALVGRHERHIFSLALRLAGRREEAEELTQATFLTALEHLHDFRGEAKFSTWLIKIAANHAMTSLRKRKKQTTALSEDAALQEDYSDIPRPDFVAQWTAGPDELAAGAEIRLLVTEALNALDEKHRAVFILRDVEGFSTEDTAETLKISTTNVKVRLLRARLKLREILTRALGDTAFQAAGDHSHD